MKFYMPVKVFQEKDCVWNHREELADLGNRALIVTGRHSSSLNGSLQDVQKALESQGTEYVIYDKIEENPSVETVMDAREFGLSQGADYVVGIGGGSPLDAAKAIALMMANKERGADLFCRREEVRAPLKVAAVPTTCGTGSEVTPFAILTVHEKRTKSSMPYYVFPELAFVDGKYLCAASQSVIANTAVDALGHLIESYCNRNATQYSRMLCIHGMEVWAQNKEVILGTKKALPEDYQGLMYVSSIAGMAITHTGTSLPHGMSYKLTYEHQIPHGKAVGIFLAAYLEGACREERELILCKLKMQSCIELREFITRAVGAVQVEESFLQQAVKEMMANARKLANCPYEVDASLMEKMYRNSVEIEEK